MNGSTFIRKLLHHEISDLKEELKLNESLWDLHYPDLSKTSLRNGKSIHLQWCNNDLIPTKVYWNKFPKTKSIIESITLNNTIGRVYWHRLFPKERIDAHDDSVVPFVRDGRLLKRYQIYLDVDSKAEIYFNHNLVDPEWLSNSLIDFELRENHSYINNSSSTLYLLVFDTVKI